MLSILFMLTFWHTTPLQGPVVVIAVAHALPVKLGVQLHLNRFEPGDIGRHEPPFTQPGLPQLVICDMVFSISIEHDNTKKRIFIMLVKLLIICKIILEKKIYFKWTIYLSVIRIRYFKFFKNIINIKCQIYSRMYIETPHHGDTPSSWWCQIY